MIDTSVNCTLKIQYYLHTVLITYSIIYVQYYLHTVLFTYSIIYVQYYLHTHQYFTVNLTSVYPCIGSTIVNDDQQAETILAYFIYS